MREKNKLPLSKNSSVLFISFSKWNNGKRLPTNGSIEPLRDFLVPKIRKLVLIDQLHPGGEGVMPRIEVYRNNNMHYVSHRSSWLLYMLKPLLDLYNVSSTQPLFKIRDFFSVIDWSFRDKEVFDYCICLESINTIAAILLKRLGRIKKVIYYVSDYSPNRYKNVAFNSVYLALDRFCAMHADYIWDVSKAMQPARIKAGLDPKRSAPVIHVANGLYPEQIKANPINKVNRHALAYMGTVSDDNGPDIAIKALSQVLKEFKDATLHIIGGEEKELIWLKDLVGNLELSKSIAFHGFIPSNDSMSEVLRKCQIGLAPYKDIPGSIRKYADAGKIRAYCAAGLAVVCSQVPPLGKEVEKKGGAIIARDNPAAFANTISKIFSNRSLYKKLRENAILFAKDSTWKNTFSNAFRQMQ